MTGNVSKGNDDVLGFGHHRFNASYFISYGFLFGGMFFFGWDPLYIYLSIAFEAILSVSSFIYKVWARLSFVKAFITSVFILPALLIPVDYAIDAFSEYHVSSEESSGWASLGVLVYAGLLVYNTVMHFQRSTLKFMRFLDGMNEKYVFENGRPMVPDSSRISEGIFNAWLLVLGFLLAWHFSQYLGATGTSAEESADHFVSKRGAIVIIILTMVKDLLGTAIYEMAYPRGEDQEMLFLKRWGYKEKVFDKQTGKRITFQ